ncbi:GTP-binding protein [Psychromonas sp. RZ22]|uniref:CobW family GTP-binding protein n=1 Tax=Psychromonas algarum TaxID=2555643 RepID=UPI0010685283|nr:GTP-binding protein [Psychromonas sp. RZ22]TEW54853.1 GTP-binding protein [Psychromonas sp. RZ22]
MNKEMIQGVPTNIITGFLGSGKTSAILHLLKNKPADERWAVLVNEFGEIGVDGSFLTGKHTKEQGIFIREVPGGCMCCAAGLPMQVALNQLLKNAKPDRLLIEPTGLGHPKEILQVLSAEHYQQTLSLQKTLTLIDARNLHDTRYTEHATFNQQIAIADTLVGSKADLYQEADKTCLMAYAKAQGKENVSVIFAEYGNIAYSQLIGKSAIKVAAPHSHHHEVKKSLATEIVIPACGFIKSANQGEGFNSVGWRFSPQIEFNYKKLFIFLNSLKVERMKGVFITDKGMFAYNATHESLQEMALDSVKESRIEIISQQLDNKLEAHLMACYLSQ